jgi:hypothetical protein
MSENLLSHLAASPDVYVQKIDVVREAALLVRFDEQSYRNASFLDDRILGPATKGGWTPLARMLEAAKAVQQRRPVHFIFHSGHVGSTLLSRLLDSTGAVLSLREPLPLRTLAELHDVLSQPESLVSSTQFDAITAALLALWSRGHASTRAVIVKATSSVGRFAPALLASADEARAVYLNVHAEPYLATLLAGANSAIDLRGHAAVRFRGLQRRLDGSITPLHALSIGELAAMSWLAEAWNEHDTAAQSPQRVLRLDFEHMLSNLRASVERVLSHFGLPQEESFLSGIHRSPVLTRYSKAAEFEYSPQVRLDILNQARRDHRDQIGRGMAWLETLARSEVGVAALLNAGG